MISNRSQTKNSRTERVDTNPGLLSGPLKFVLSLYLPSVSSTNNVMTRVWFRSTRRIVSGDTSYSFARSTCFIPDARRIQMSVIALESNLVAM